MPRTCPSCGWVWPKPTGPCPECGSTAAPEIDLTDRETGADAEEHQRVRMPWHLKLLVIAFAIYLGWRIWQLVAWLLR